MRTIKLLYDNDKSKMLTNRHKWMENDRNEMKDQRMLEINDDGDKMWNCRSTFQLCKLRQFYHIEQR